MPGIRKREKIQDQPIQLFQIPVRRSTREVQPLDWHSHNLTLISTEEKDPSTVLEAKSATDRAEWEMAMTL